jgi:type VI secretion system protein ImpB
MADDEPIAQRVNIKYSPAIGGAGEQKELPFRMLVTGDFSGGNQEGDLEARKPVDITPHNFDSVLGAMNVSVKMSVPDHLSDEEGASRAVELEMNTMKDFGPDRVVDQVDDLRRLRDIRDALEQLKTAFMNEADFRRQLNQIVEDPGKAEAILNAIGMASKD